ncbi:hypothetical protein B296_00010234 [Ensete ventricosum]|uniref:Uncharacterized protein n=1 Tax=Ensete ventricosum TaxID=4639 RepID=A0A426ZU05_ENSVE|nr:hypothetical protein B296_00010234 [Ensete ventricosum]
MQGRPPTARSRPRPTRKGRPLTGAATCRGGTYGHSGLWPACKGDSHPQRGVHKGVGCRTTCASGGRQCPARKGLPPMARPQGAAARGVLARGAAACAGAAAAATATQRATRRGLGYPFEKRMILPL